MCRGRSLRGRLRGRVNPARHLFRSLLVLALFVAGELAASAHFAFVQHRVCAEHGELEHGELEHGQLEQGQLEQGQLELGQSQHAELACGTPEDAEHAHGPVLTAGDADSADHEHCPLGDKLAPRTSPVAFRAQVALGVARPAPLAPRTDAFARAFPLHLLAPKHSPPAVS